MLDRTDPELRFSEPITQNAMAFGETFLAAPEASLSCDGEELWGRETATVDLPGGPYRFAGLDAAQKALIEGAFPLCPPFAEHGFAVEGRFAKADAEAFLPLDQIRWQKLIDVDYQADAVRLAGHPWLAVITLTPQLRCVVRTPCATGPAFADLFENVFRVVVAYRLLLGGLGLLVHSAGLSDGRGGYLFAGRSGDGKSTLSRLALEAGLEVLSDDGNAVLLDGNDGGRRRPCLAALPFGGDLRPREMPRTRYPLRVVAALDKGKNHRAPLAGAAAVALLTACAPFVNGDPYRSDLLLETAARIVADVETCRLTFSRGGGFWKLFEAPGERVSPVLSAGLNLPASEARA